MKTTDGKLEEGGGLKTGGFFSNCGRGGGAIENKQMRGGGRANAEVQGSPSWGWEGVAFNFLSKLLESEERENATTVA